MRSLAAIAVLVIVTPILSLVYLNDCIDGMLRQSEVKTSYNTPTYATLTIPDTGYNSAEDLLQTASGTFVYQAANYEAIQ